ncbi:hypothetical protein ACFLZX_01350 [Nanoarchaeota archaeon]
MDYKPQETKAVAEYLRSLDFCVDKVRQGSTPLFYLLPDIHIPDFAHHHVRVIDNLVANMGLGIVGIEGGSGLVTQSTVDEFVDHWIEDKKKVGDRKDLVEEYLQERPLFKYGLEGSPVALFGIEDDILHQDHKTVIDIHDAFVSAYAEVLIDMAQFLGRDDNIQRYSSKKIVQSFIDSVERACKRNIDPLLEKLSGRYSLPDYVQGWNFKLNLNKKEIPPVYEKNPFFKAVNRLREKIHYRRTAASLDIALQETRDRELDQIAIVYGEGHLKEMREKLSSDGFSHIVISPSQEVIEAGVQAIEWEKGKMDRFIRERVVPDEDKC